MDLKDLNDCSKILRLAINHNPLPGVPRLSDVFVQVTRERYPKGCVKRRCRIILNNASNNIKTGKLYQLLVE